jgi:hypothetical protein
MKRLRGFWWRGFQTRRMRGLFRFVERDRFDDAAARFERSYADDPEGSCRRLFFDLLAFRADEEQDARGIVEQSCDTVAQAATLVRIFPDARFIHVVRDGRDASASRVSQTRGIVYPRTRRQGIDWFERRIRRIDAGARLIPEDQLMQVSLEELLTPPRFGAARGLAEFVGVSFSGRMQSFFFAEMNAQGANTERWRQGISESRQESLDNRYRKSLARLEADGVSATELLHKSYERLPELGKSQGEASESG